ncbi:MAG TPA: TonB family protein [Pyrinomonadaceae bacterium]|nr:TonB family protein [Pyrinomonadaceae bacterium]
MKSILALATIILALSFCNLVGKRGNSNENANARSSGTSTESSAPPAEDRSAKTPQAAPPPPPPATSLNEGAGPQMPGTKSTPRAEIPKTVSGGVLNGKATSLPQPTYPPIARAAHASGAVNVQVTVDESGNVISANAVSGHPLLKQSAVAAARQARFSPTKLSGQPVKVTGIIVYNFREQ